MFLLALGATSIAAAFDLRSRRIPNLIPVLLVTAVAVIVAMGLHPLGWRSAALGLVAGAAAGIGLYALRAFGGGDAKLLIALGATLGLAPFLLFLITSSIAGGALALVARRRGSSEIPYAPAMLLGLLMLLPLRWIG